MSTPTRAAAVPAQFMGATKFLKKMTLLTITATRFMALATEKLFVTTVRRCRFAANILANGTQVALASIISTSPSRTLRSSAVSLISPI